MESVDNHDSLGGIRIIICREHLRGETPSATIDGSHLEMVELSWLQLHVVAVLRADICAIVEVGFTHSGIEDIASRFRGGLLRIVNGIPTDSDLGVVFEFDTEIVGSQWSHDERASVLVVDITQDCLVDRTSQRKAEVRILS